MKKQVVVIHGAEAFDTYEDYLRFLQGYQIKNLDDIKENRGWKSSLAERLGDDYEVVAPRMPNSLNSRYSEWKIWFDKIAPLLNSEVVLVGNSMGSIFLVKYLSENDLKSEIKSLHLAGTPFDAEGTNDTLVDFAITTDFRNLEKQVSNIFFYQSKDDPAVPFDNVEKYRKLLPNAHYTIFEDRGHFRQEEFPELVENIRKFS
jgi:predicted alpha/beta hydrolase family esterase